MASNKRFPAEPFWDFSLDIYAKPEVAEASLFLQDEFGLDVNILLACLWSEANGPGRLNSEQIRECLNRTREWQDKVVKPLRIVRRFSKKDPAVVPDEFRKIFRPGLQAVELDAEHVEQLVIADVLREFAKQVDTGKHRARGQGGVDAIQNLLAYLALQGVSLEDRVTQKLRTLVVAAFPEADLTALQGSGD